MGDTFTIPRQVAIEGAVEFPETVVIEGTVVGDVICKEIVVSECGAVEGTLIAEMVTVLGEASGSIYADTVTLKAASLVTAEIFHGKLNLESGCYFEGKSRRVAQPRNLADRALVEVMGVEHIIR
jgi:cytoskeletal protein CcmA (bactofilin family)